jgi:hypothetical protein
METELRAKRKWVKQTKPLPPQTRVRVSFGGHIPLDVLPSISNITSQLAQVGVGRVAFGTLKRTTEGKVPLNRKGHTRTSYQPVHRGVSPAVRNTTKKHQHMIIQTKPKHALNDERGGQKEQASVLASDAPNPWVGGPLPGLAPDAAEARPNGNTQANLSSSPPDDAAPPPTMTFPLSPTRVTLGGMARDRQKGMQVPRLPALPPDITATKQAKRVTVRGAACLHTTIFTASHFHFDSPLSPPSLHPLRHRSSSFLSRIPPPTPTPPPLAPHSARSLYCIVCARLWRGVFTQRHAWFAPYNHNSALVTVKARAITHSS